MAEDTLYRDQQRQYAESIRKAARGHNWCDLCHKDYGSQYHEIISRGRTQANEEARNLSFQAELCSLLCPNCHARWGSSRLGRYALLCINIYLFGYDKVSKAFYGIQEIYRREIEFPSKEDWKNASPREAWTVRRGDERDT